MSAAIHGKTPRKTEPGQAPEAHSRLNTPVSVIPSAAKDSGDQGPSSFGSLSEVVIQAVLDGLDDALFLLDMNERILAVNAAAGTFAHENGSFSHWPDILDLAVTDREALQRAWHVLRQDNEVRLECTLRRPTSNEMVAAEVLLRNVPIRGRTLRVVTIRDISAHKSRENRLRRLASIDDLTQVANRRHFMAMLEQETGRARRYGHPVALLMVDADHFKSINDRFGHDTGDQALQLLAHVAKKVCRSADVVGRIGGEEFAILLPETRIEKAIHVAERLRLTVAETPLTVGDQSLSMTVSIGASAACGATCDSQALLKRADAALYAAKNQGRNRVIVDAQATRRSVDGCTTDRVDTNLDST